MGSELTRRLLCAWPGGRRRAEEAKGPESRVARAAGNVGPGRNCSPHPSFFLWRSEQGRSPGFLLVKGLGRRVGRGGLGS